MSQQAKPHPLIVERAERVSFTLRDLLVYFVRLGTFGFGGPIALAGYMQKDLVQQRRWVSNSDYLEGLAFSQLSPGPLAAQRARP
jgi:chromate transporter